MYLMPDFVDMGMGVDKEFQSEIHRDVAISILIGNPYVTTMEDLSKGCELIDNIPTDKIKTVTYNELHEMGCPGCI